MDVPTSSWLLEVLRLCRQGDQGAAIDLYRKNLDTEEGVDIPVGFHARLLTGGGYSRAATVIQRAGLLAGADVSSCALARGGDLRNAVEEYRALFASGSTTTKMVMNYMVCLSRVGEAAELAAVAAPEQLFYCGRLRLSGDAPVEPFLQRVSAALRSAKERESHTSYRSARNLDRVHETHRMGDPAILELHSAIHAAAAEYMKKVASTSHLISICLPTKFELRSWSMISEGTGYNEPHAHCPNWVSGVVYVEGEDPALSGTDDAGLLRIGAGVGGDPKCPGWPDLAVAPVPGTIVLMPSYYTHWTVPLRRPGSVRISVAFNVVPASKATDIPEN